MGERNTGDESEHEEGVRTLLPAYVGGALDALTRLRVEDHLARCPACCWEVATWRQAGQVLRDESYVDVPPAHVLAAVVEQITREEAREEGRMAHTLAKPYLLRHSRAAPRSRMVTYVWKIVREQARLVRGSTWLASALVMALGWMVAVSTEAASAALVLQLVAPVVAACGVSLIYGPETDPFLEVVQATPASPRLLLLARLTVVFGYDCALALAATLGLTVLGRGGGVWSLTQDWLGPLLFLSALALVLAHRLGPSSAMSIALLLWGIRVALVANGHIGLLDSHLAQFLAASWSTNALTVSGALVLLGVALVSAHHQERRGWHGWGWNGWRSA
jgi:hypothetical protein